MEDIESGPKYPETDPRRYSVAMDVWRMDKEIHVTPDEFVLMAREEQMEDWAVSVNMRTGQIYVSVGHKGTLRRHPIPLQSYCTAIIQFSDDFNDFEFSHFFDWRGETKLDFKPRDENPTRDAVLTAVRRAILKPSRSTPNADFLA